MLLEQRDLLETIRNCRGWLSWPNQALGYKS